MKKYKNVKEDASLYATRYLFHYPKENSFTMASLPLKETGKRAIG